LPHHSRAATSTRKTAKLRRSIRGENCCAWAYYKEGNVRAVPALLMALGLLAGSPLGARVAQQFSPLMLRRSFAVFLVLVAARLWWGKA